MKTKKKIVDLRFLYLFIPLLLLEVFFRIAQFGKFDIFTSIRTVLYVLFESLFFCFIFTRFKTNKVYFIVGLILVIWHCGYTFAELIFKNFMGDWYSFGTVSDGATRIAQFAGIFLSSAKPVYYLCLIPILVYILLNIFVKIRKGDYPQIMPIACILSFLLIIPCMNLGSGSVSNLHVYATFNNKDVLVDKLGIQHFLFRDLTALAYKTPETIVIEKVDEEIEIIEKEKSRNIDDSLWKNIASQESNSNMQTIDSYLMAKQISQPNEMTGAFEGYNFIYFLVESGDYLMIDKELTPNLYKLYNDSIQFENHYTPLYSCATGESEFVSYNSLFPYENVCTPNYCQNVKYYNALPWLFKNEGYKSFGIHNWRDEWYERNDILNNMGIDTYYDIDNIWQDKTIQHTDGWQSDEMLIEQAWKHIEEFGDDKYMAMIISSVMHFPYDEYSYWGDYYLDRINEVHPDWGISFKRYMSKSMNFDEGIGYLLDKLEESGQLDHTVICMYCDHRPYWVDYDKLIEYTSWLTDRSEYSDFGDGGSEKIGIYNSPFIIYNSEFGKMVNRNYCSTLDHVPTIANLFNLKYDPRLYMGKDAFDSDSTVIFTNGDWLNQNGIYDASKEKFTPANGKSMPSTSYIERTNKQVQNQINISHLILDEDYFEKRKDICIAKYIEEETKNIEEED